MLHWERSRDPPGAGVCSLSNRSHYTTVSGFFHALHTLALVQWGVRRSVCHQQPASHPPWHPPVEPSTIRPRPTIAGPGAGSGSRRRRGRGPV